MSEENNGVDEVEEIDEAAEKEPQETSMAEQLEKAKQDYLYLAADFENFRKNAIKERSDLVKFGNERLLRELLAIVDDFERALEVDGGDSKESLKSGVQMIFQELTQLLQRFGVKELDSKGKPFDPTLHEALSSEPSSEIPPGHITKVFKKAYKFHDRLLRPAQVIVAAEPSNKE